MCRKALVNRGIEPIIPPQRNAVIHHTSQDPWELNRNDAVETIAGLGNDEEARKLWKKLKRYHRKSLGETAMFRYKVLIGDRLRARKTPYQEAEVYAACLVLNKMSALGMPKGKWCC